MPAVRFTATLLVEATYTEFPPRLLLLGPSEPDRLVGEWRRMAAGTFVCRPQDDKFSRGFSLAMEKLFKKVCESCTHEAEPVLWRYAARWMQSEMDHCFECHLSKLTEAGFDPRTLCEAHSEATPWPWSA